MAAKEERFDRTIDRVRRAQAGDRDALGELLECFREPLLSRIRLMMGEKARRVAESEDFLQNVFAALVRDIERFEIRDDGAFLRWATQIARNAIRDRVRRRRERAFDSLSGSVVLGAVVRQGEPSPLSQVAHEEQHHRLAAALCQLPEEHRRVIELRDLDGLSFREIAELLGKPSEGAAQMLHARALARLTKLLG